MMFVISKGCFILFEKAVNVSYYELGLYVYRDCSNIFLMFHTYYLCIHNTLIWMYPTLLYFPYINKGILVSISARILETEVIFFIRQNKPTKKKIICSPKYLDICLEISGKISVIQLVFVLLQVSWNTSHGRRKSFDQQRGHVTCCILIINTYWLMDRKLQFGGR